MPATLTIRDETAAGETTHELTIDILTEHLTVRDLIRSRVYQEVKDHNANPPAVFRGLIQPNGAEATLNGSKLRTPRMIDWKPQFERAVEAFEAHQVLILVNDRQAERLDERIVVGPGTVISFVRLVPLVGG